MLKFYQGRIPPSTMKINPPRILMIQQYLPAVTFSDLDRISIRNKSAHNQHLSQILNSLTLHM